MSDELFDVVKLAIVRDLEANDVDTPHAVAEVIIRVFVNPAVEVLMVV
jgi:hypothetical protein